MGLPVPAPGADAVAAGTHAPTAASSPTRTAAGFLLFTVVHTYPFSIFATILSTIFMNALAASESES